MPDKSIAPEFHCTVMAFLSGTSAKINVFLLHVLGLGCICNPQHSKLLPLYNTGLALLLCLLGFIVYVEKKFLYTGIFATCLQFVQYYLIQTHVFYTVLQTTIMKHKYQSLLKKTDCVQKRLGLVLLAVYSAVGLSALFFDDQFVSFSCWLSLYLSTVTSALYVNHLVGLLDSCGKALGALNSSLEALGVFPSTLVKMAKCLSGCKVDSVCLRKVLVRHRALCDLAKSILQLATVSVALLLLTGCFGFSVLLYKIAMYFISTIQVRRSQWATVYMVDCQTIVLFVEIYVLTRSSETVMRNANRIAIVLHGLRNVYPDFGGEMFNAHSMKLLNQKLSLTLSGVFVLDYGLLNGILVTFGTLVVISLQCDEDFLVTNPKTVLMMALNKTV